VKWANETDKPAIDDRVMGGAAIERDQLALLDEDTGLGHIEMGVRVACSWEEANRIAKGNGGPTTANGRESVYVAMAGSGQKRRLYHGTTTVVLEGVHAGGLLEVLNEGWSQHGLSGGLASRGSPSSLGSSGAIIFGFRYNLETGANIFGFRYDLETDSGGVGVGVGVGA